MNLFLIAFLAGITSAAAYILINRAYVVSLSSLRRAFGALLDWIALFTLFFGANLGLGVVAILFIRGFTPRFVSVYELQNLLLLIVSGAQAFLFHHLWKRS